MTTLVKKQHVLPAKSISRFCSTKGLVWVQLLAHGKSFEAAPNNNAFTVSRLWDQRAEQGYGLKIEDRFQSIAESIVNTKKYTGCKILNQRITEFYALWLVRAHADIWKNMGSSDQSRLTFLQKENAELKHASYINEDDSLPARFLVGGLMQREIDFFVDQQSSLAWSLCESECVEFVVADRPCLNFVIPISPNFCLSGVHSGGVLLDEKVREINLQSIMNSKKYYFARDLKKSLY